MSSTPTKKRTVEQNIVINVETQKPTWVTNKHFIEFEKLRRTCEKKIRKNRSSIHTEKVATFNNMSVEDAIQKPLLGAVCGEIGTIKELTKR